jgi:sialic acid synthase SpsE
MLPEEFSEMRERLNIVEKSLGDGIKQPSSSEVASIIRFRKTMYAKNDIKKGAIISESDIIYTAPAYGIYAKYEDIVFGKTANQNISKDTPITWDVLS